jgi:predicted RND superfamily exporter protein
MKRFNHLIVQWPKLTLLLGLLLTSFFGYHAWHFRIDSSIENLYAQDNPNEKYYEEVRALFGRTIWE